MDKRKILNILDQLVGFQFDADIMRDDVLEPIADWIVENTETKGVGDAKLGCKLDDIQWWEDVTVMYTVDVEGEPTFRVDSTDGDFKCYYCEKCGQDWASTSVQDQEMCWEQAKAHLGGK